MKRVILALAWAAMAASYLTDNPITEPPNIALAASDDVDNMAALGSDCEPEKSTKGAEEQGQPPPDHPQCSGAVYVRLGDGSSVDSAPERDLLGETGNALVRPRRGGRANDNFIRFGRGGRNDNYIRFGRGGKHDNFIRFGRDRSDNFIRFGRGRTDNFIRLGRGKSDNFIRLGRGRDDNFIRFGRNKQDNFIRFGRDMKVSNDRDETDVSSKDELSTSNNLRVGRGGRSDSNFIRLGRAGPSSSFTQPQEMRRSNGNFVRFGRQTYEDNLERVDRSSGNNDLRRGKLTDRNFIRLGRSGQQYNDDTEGERDDTYVERLGRSDKRGKTQNFIRFGKRADEDEQLVRFGRDVAHTEDTPALPSGDSVPSDNANETNKHIRSRRSVISSGEDETPEDSSGYAVVISKNEYDDKISTVDDSQIPFKYYSPLASGLPNYILSPELSVLAPLTNGGETKKGKGDDHNRNYIRLG
jgi:hypothetical protein